MWQNIIVAGIIITALTFTVRRYYKITAKKDSPGCGCGCSAACGDANEPLTGQCPSKSI